MIAGEPDFDASLDERLLDVIHAVEIDLEPIRFGPIEDDQFGITIIRHKRCFGGIVEG